MVIVVEDVLLFEFQLVRINFHCNTITQRFFPKDSEVWNNSRQKKQLQNSQCVIFKEYCYFGRQLTPTQCKNSRTGHILHGFQGVVRSWSSNHAERFKIHHLSITVRNFQGTVQRWLIRFKVHEK